MANPISDNSRDATRVHGLETVEVFRNIEDPDGTKPVIGVIKDISGTGAHIRIMDAQDLPDRVLLTSHSIGDRRTAIIRWRDGTNIGVHFDEPLME